MNIFVKLLNSLAILSTGTSECYTWFIDEPEAPKSIIEK